MNTRVREMLIGTDEILKMLLFQSSEEIRETPKYLIRVRHAGRLKYPSPRHDYQRQANRDSVRRIRTAEVISQEPLSDRRLKIMLFDETRKRLIIYRNEVELANKELPGFSMALADSLEQFATGMRIIDERK